VIRGVVDFHIHSAPSLAPRHGLDQEAVASAREAGITTAVLKAHEGSSAGRAVLVGHGVLGGVVLNSPVGGANPEAVRVAGLLGGRVVWLPTISSPAHRNAHENPELEAHKGISFREVPVVDGGDIRPEWLEVFDEIAAADMVLASGHLTMDETVCAFTAARARGVRRLLVNHPLMAFLGWRPEHAERLAALDARIEVGVLADLLHESDEKPTEYLVSHYPTSLLVFGSDLGHANYPSVREGILDWERRVAATVGDRTLERIMTENGRRLLD
jgi:hypothetical protein